MRTDDFEIKWCPQDDCFSCPYSDCISKYGLLKDKKAKLSPEERKARKAQRDRQWRNKNRERVNAAARERYRLKTIN